MDLIMATLIGFLVLLTALAFILDALDKRRSRKNGSGKAET
jgi:uncharacterized membrane protein YsdA (DUF1294 family)